MYVVQKEQEQEEPIEVLINKFIKSLNSYDWVSCLYLSKIIEDKVSALLLSQWNEPNYITDEFKTLRLWLVSDLNHELKAMQVRECLSDIWDKLSKYGIGVSREIKDEKQLGEMISNILLQMDSLISGVFSRSPAIKNASIQAINSYLTKLELSLKGFYSDDVALNEFCQYALTDLRRFKGELNKVASEDNINKLKEGVSDAYTLFKDSMEKLAEAIMYPKKRESIYITFETLRNVDLTRGKTQEEVKEVQEVVEVEYPATSGEIEHSSFDWVDSEWREILRHPAIYLILGRRGGGKSTLGYTIAEYLLTTYNVKGYLLDVSREGIPHEKLKLLPPWLRVVRHIDDVPPNSVLLVDEAHMKFHARVASTSGEAIVLDELIGLSRQNKQSHIYVTHQSDKIDKNIVNSIDVLLIKPTNPFQQDTERKGLLQEYIRKATREFEKLREKGTIDLRSYVYVVANYMDYAFVGMKTWKPGSSWKPELSYFYQGVR